MELNFNAENRLGVTCLSLSGGLDISSRKKLTEIAKILSGKGAVRCAVDMSEIVSMDAMGYVALLNFREIFTKAGAAIALCSVNPDVFERIVKSDGLNKFKILNTLQDAVDMLVVSPTGHDAIDNTAKKKKRGSTATAGTGLLKKQTPPLEAESIKAILKTWEELQHDEDKKAKLAEKEIKKNRKIRRYIKKRGPGIILFIIVWILSALAIPFMKTPDTRIIDAFDIFNMLMAITAGSSLFINPLSGKMVITSAVSANLFFPAFYIYFTGIFAGNMSFITSLLHDPRLTKACLIAIIYLTVKLFKSNHTFIKCLLALPCYISIAWLTGLVSYPLTIICEKRLFDTIPAAEPYNITIIITVPAVILLWMLKTISGMWQIAKTTGRSSRGSRQRLTLRYVITLEYLMLLIPGAAIWFYLIAAMIFSR